MARLESSLSPRVQPLTPRQLSAAVELHRSVLHAEAITRFGAGFMGVYYQAYLDSPHGVALVAVNEDDGRVVGGLLGTVQPQAHYRFLARRYGLRLTAAVLAASLRQPDVGRMLVQTRLRRYVGGVVRQWLGRPKLDRQPCLPNEPAGGSLAAAGQGMQAPACVAEVTHLFIAGDCQSYGIGSDLIERYEAIARAHGVEAVDLVTLPLQQGGAGPFYERLGWSLRDARVSRSGEQFLLYRKHLQ